jgi:signal transduction histidine kinase
MPSTTNNKRTPGCWPRSLFGRLLLILVCALLAAQAMTFGSIWYERSLASRSMMRAYLARDVASAIAMLERLDASERAGWLDRLGRNNYRYRLGRSPAITGPDPLADEIAADLSSQLKGAYAVTAGRGTDGRPRLELRLKDATPVAIEILAGAMPLSGWLPFVLAAEFALLAVAAWLAVNLATRPLSQLVRAAQAWTPNSRGVRMAEAGPSEVTGPARAFNAMQARIDAHLEERSRILASIAHDLQTPITRMRLRAELLDSEDERGRWLRDLEAMQALVAMGIEYARSAAAPSEPARKVDVDALITALAADYQDAGRAVDVNARAEAGILTHPLALRRILSNLVDNALKFAGAASIETSVQRGWLCVAVLDAGPGIPEEHLRRVVEPFYRIEQSRNPDTGGTGLGLAIAEQLALQCGGRLELSNRPAGGLCAAVWLPLNAQVGKTPASVSLPTRA